MNLIILFTILSFVNVILMTLHSIATVKCGKWVAAFVNAIAYGVYTFVIVYMNADMSIWLKAGITALANFIGVWVVKFIEEKSRKDKLWKIEVTVPNCYVEDAMKELEGIPMSKIPLSNDYTLFLCYCASQKESEQVKYAIGKWDAKFFVTEQNGVL